MYLPGDLIPSLISYMDQETLSVMSRTCKAWKFLIYRTSVWSSFTWRPRQSPFFPPTVYPSPFIRHIGEPNLVCFFSWIVGLLHDSENTLPLYLITLQDPKLFAQKVYQYWRSTKKPCTVTHHHIWSDVCTLRATLPTLSSDKRYTLKVTLVNPCNITQDNAYANWIEQRILDLEAVPTEGPALVPTGSTLINEVLNANHTLLTKRLDVLQKLRDVLMENFKTSRRALRSYSVKHFDLADTLLKTHSIDLYDAAIISYAKEP